MSYYVIDGTGELIRVHHRGSELVPQHEAGRAEQLDVLLNSPDDETRWGAESEMASLCELYDPVVWEYGMHEVYMRTLGARMDEDLPVACAP